MVQGDDPLFAAPLAMASTSAAPAREPAFLNRIATVFCMSPDFVQVIA